MIVAIMQPYLLPYAGYYQLMMAADKFILLDDVAYINKGWINRNRIIINGTAQYFTVPLEGASQNRLINDINLVAEDKWRIKLERTVEMAYKKAPFFKDSFPLFRAILHYEELNLSTWLAHSFKLVTEYLGIQKQLIPSSSIYNNNHLKAQEKIIDICRHEKATTYINLPGGRALYDSDCFRSAGIQLKFIQPQLPVYQQAGAHTFVEGLSLLDLLMNRDKQSTLAYLNHYTIG